VLYGKAMINMKLLLFKNRYNSWSTQVTDQLSTDNNQTTKIINLFFFFISINLFILILYMKN